MARETEGSSIQVIQRMASLLDRLAAADGPVSLKLLSAETGLHASTAHRILNTLLDIGYVERTRAGHYQLGVRLLQLGNRVQMHVDLRREALPVMESLRDLVGETVNLTVREGDEVVYIERVSGTRNMRVELVIGGRAPLHVTAVGKMFLAEEGAAGVREYIARTGLEPFTANSVTSPDTLMAQVQAAAREGYARDEEETEDGVACLGVAVRDGTGRVVAGLSISAPADRLRTDWVGALQAAGLRLSERLGYYAREAADG
ncbi:IclR family transcriptional regulator [Spiribacter halobius]|uniref:IclR family transcriptional regulator n=1 Tax=Sediminicurvatus halobius TaxID=2182432 RepID=A0A2U2N2A9_9GAMM|nr:IclR family transcriptional regulator [Spiribacter halobius]PWG63203.1 IclR family transcriptional regulator [Spiribacter halobius]UEX76727.1 IclR family transcriptional regulator [Spiribacter halobius]